MQALESGKVPNAYLFTGPEGVGKDAMAIEVAKTLNCQTPGKRNIEACDECESCKAIGALASPLLEFVFAQAKSQKASDSSSSDDDDESSDIDVLREQIALKAADPYYNIVIPKAITISLPQVRQLISHLARSVARGSKRIVIISEADTMIAAAQNAFLKTLEEPHENTLIILTSSNPARLYPTILSRCQDVRFDLLSAEEISKSLQEEDGLEKQQAEFLARLSGGSYAAARRLINDEVGELRKQVVGFLRMGLSKSRKNAVDEIDKIIPKRGGAFLEKRQNVEQMLDLLELWLRDALALSSGAESAVFNADQLEDLRRFTSRFGNPSGLVTAIHAVDAAKRKVFLQLQLRPVLLELIMELERALVPAA